jgi:hypothetical protein
MHQVSPNSPLYLDLHPTRGTHRVGIRGNFNHFDAAVALMSAILNEGANHNYFQCRVNANFQKQLMRAALDFDLVIQPITWICFPGHNGRRILVSANWKPKNGQPIIRAGIIYKNGALTLAKGDSSLLSVPEAIFFINAANVFLSPIATT